MCLATFVSSYRIVTSQSSKLRKPKNSYKDNEQSSDVDTDVDNDCDHLHPIQLQNGLGFIKKRPLHQHAIIIFPTFSKDKDPQRHYLNLLKLFLPHQNKDVIPPEYLSAEQFFLKGTVIKNGKQEEISQIVLTNQNLFHKLQKEVDDAIEDLNENGVPEDAWGEIAPNIEQQRLDQIKEIPSK